MTSAASREQRIVARFVAAVSLLCGAFVQPLGAQADTSRIPSLFTYRDVVLAGGFAAATLLIRPLDEDYAHRLQDSSTQDSRRLHQLAQFVRTTTAPGSYIIGTSMYLAGRLTRNDRLATLGLRGSEALVLGEAVGGVLKGFVGRQRPVVAPRNSHSYQLLRGFTDGDNYQSFPSGHTVAAFAAAAAVTSETAQWWPNTRWLIGSVLYGGAALTGASRMYDNRHWASDVIVGAAIGTFAGLKVVRYHGSHPGSLVDRWFLRGSLVPADAGGYTLHWAVAPGAELAAPPRSR